MGGLPMVDVIAEPSQRDFVRARWRRRLRGVAPASFVLVTLLGLFGPFAGAFGLGMKWGEALGWGTIVLGSWIPTLFEFEWILLIVGASAAITRLALAPESPPTTRPRRLVTTVALVTGGVILTLAVPLALFSSLIFNSSVYKVLPTASENGCRVAVHQHSFLTSAGGVIGVVQPGEMSVEWMSTYYSDDGYLPFSANRYTLQWRGNTAIITLGDGPVQSTELAPHADLASKEPVTCD